MSVRNLYDAFIKVVFYVSQRNNETILVLNPEKCLLESLMGDLLGRQEEVPGAWKDVSEVKFEGHVVVQDREGVSA